MATSYLHAQKLIGRDPKSLLPIPGPEDTEGWGNLYTTLGRPEKADGYVLDATGKRAFTDADKAFQSAMLPVLHEAGLTQKQLDKLMPAIDAWNAKVGGDMKGANERAMQTNLTALKTEWGAAYTENLNHAASAMAHYGNEKLFAELEGGQGNNPELVKIFATLGKQLADDGLVGKAGAVQGLLSPAEAQQHIAGKQQDKAFMDSYRNKAATGHAEAIAAMEKLYQQAYPPQSAA